MEYPPARRADVVDNLHGHLVPDPYRWLEDPESAETRAWSAAQDELTAGWLARLESRDGLRSRLEELLPGFVGPPEVVGSRRFFRRRLPGQEHAVLLVADDADDSAERVLIDPSALAADHTVTLDGWAPSIEGGLLAYQLSEGGDEESTLRVMDVGTGETVDGPVDRVRYSPVAWLPGGRALFYVRRLPESAVPAGEGQFHRRVYLHRVGTDPSEDVEVFGADCDMTAYFGLEASQDGRWLAVTVSLGTAPRNDLYLADLGAAPSYQWTAVMAGTDAQAWPHFGLDGRLYILTDLGAPRRRLVSADPRDPRPERWAQLLPEDPEGSVLEGMALAGGAIVAARSLHAVSRLTVHDRATGALQGDVSLPGLGTAGVSGRPDEGPEVWIGYTDHVTPYRTFRLDVPTGRVEPGPDPPGWAGRRSGQPIAATQVVYRSADGTGVRMFVIGQEGGGYRRRPTILYGYGGFNVSLTPAYSTSVLGWVEAGGVWAVANLRGGGEDGEEWHRDGMRDRKQHTFDDFHAAAGWLIDNGVTTRDQLAVMGGSNGGLLVGAALTQHPERYAAVSCSAPLLDMVRYERFGLGQTWNDEYGTAGDPAELEWLLGYSPYHHVTPGTPYPAVLFSVYDSDTRVDPLHARKMCAALQAATASRPDQRPVLLRREVNVGHGARSVSRTMDLAADQLAFLAAQTGLDI